MIHGVLIKAGESHRMPQIDYTSCTHQNLKRDGFRRTNLTCKQRWQCTACGKIFIEGARQNSAVAIGRALLEPGASQYTVAAVVGSSRPTIRKVDRLLRGLRPDCPCGRPAGHIGRCSFRRNR